MSDKFKAVEHEMESAPVKVVDTRLFGETKEHAFKRLAIPRVENILDRIRILGNLSDKSRYAYTEEQIDKIEMALNEAVANTISAFRGKDMNTKFTL